MHVTGAPKAAPGMRTYRQRWIQAESKAGDLPTAGRQRAGAGKGGERCFGSDPPGVRPTHPQLRGHDRADAGLGQQLWNVRGGEVLEVGLDGLGVVGEGSSATGQPPE